MKPPGQPRRSRPIARGERITPKKRTPSEFARIYGSRARVQWMKAQPCCHCNGWAPDGIDNAHTENGGMGRKAGSATIVPLCNARLNDCHYRYDHHVTPYDQHEPRAMLRFAAVEYEFRWQAESARRASLTRKER